MKQFLSTYEADVCGICEKHGEIDEHRFWFSTLSRTAHKSCIDKLNSAEKESEKLLDTYCTKYNYADYHMSVVNIVRNSVSTPLLQVLEQPHGEEHLRTEFTRAANVVREYITRHELIETQEK